MSEYNLAKRLQETSGLTEADVRDIVRGGIDAGLSEEEALSRAVPLEAYEVAQIIKEEYAKPPSP